MEARYHACGSARPRRPAPRCSRIGSSGVRRSHREHDGLIPARAGGLRGVGSFEAGPAANNSGLRAVLRRSARVRRGNAPLRRTGSTAGPVFAASALPTRRVFSRRARKERDGVFRSGKTKAAPSGADGGQRVALRSAASGYAGDGDHVASRRRRAPRFALTSAVDAAHREPQLAGGAGSSRRRRGASKAESATPARGRGSLVSRRDARFARTEAGMCATSVCALAARPRRPSRGRRREAGYHARAEPTSCSRYPGALVGLLDGSTKRVSTRHDGARGPCVAHWGG